MFAVFFNYICTMSTYVTKPSIFRSKENKLTQNSKLERTESCMVHDLFISQVFVSHVLTATGDDNGIMQFAARDTQPKRYAQPK